MKTVHLKKNLRRTQTHFENITSKIYLLVQRFLSDIVFVFCYLIRYQRVSPDCLPLTNGANKPYLRPSPSNEDTTTSIAAGRGFNGGSCTISSSLDGVPKGFRFRSTQQHDPTPSRRGGGDVLLQWGQRKRSRISRAVIRSSTTTTTPADDSSSSSGQGKTQSNKLSRRSLNPSMPPPAPVFSGRSSNNRNGIVGGKEIFLSRFSPNLHTPMHFPIFIFFFTLNV